MDVPTELRESLWLTLLQAGETVAQIARQQRLSQRRIQAGIKHAKFVSALRTAHCALRTPPREPRLVPHFGCRPWTPLSVCPHRGSYPDGSSLCCMVCHRSGRDGHPALQRDPRTDPRPEKKPPVPAGRKLTRRERRKLAAGRVSRIP